MAPYEQHVADADYPTASEEVIAVPHSFGDLLEFRLCRDTSIQLVSWWEELLSYLNQVCVHGVYQITQVMG